ARTRRADADVLRRTPSRRCRSGTRPFRGQRPRDPAPRARAPAALRNRRRSAMTREHCSKPMPLDVLVAYWLDENAVPERDRIEEHLMACSTCSAALEELVALGDGIRAAVGSGRVRAVVAGAFAQRLAAAGLRGREYPVACNGSINCTIAPDDDLVVARLEATLRGADRVDVLLFDRDGHAPERLEDVPFDANEVVIASDTAALRALPATTMRMRLVAVEHGADR